MAAGCAVRIAGFGAILGNRAARGKLPGMAGNPAVDGRRSNLARMREEGG